MKLQDFIDAVRARTVTYLNHYKDPQEKVLVGQALNSLDQAVKDVLKASNMEVKFTP